MRENHILDLGMNSKSSRLGGALFFNSKKTMKQLRLIEKSFTRFNDEAFVYTAFLEESTRLWFIQARVDRVMFSGEFKLKGFDQQALKWCGKNKACDLIEIEDKAQVLDVIKRKVKELASADYGKNFVRSTLEKLPLLEG